jgi:hypothetical protein
MPKAPAGLAIAVAAASLAPNAFVVGDYVAWLTLGLLMFGGIIAIG